MTKTEYRAQRAAWTLALAERRVVSHLESIYPERRSLVAYPDIASRDAALAASECAYIAG